MRVCVTTYASPCWSENNSPSPAMIPSTRENRRRAMVRPPCQSSKHSNDAVKSSSKMCATEGNADGGRPSHALTLEAALLAHAALPFQLLELGQGFAHLGEADLDFLPQVVFVL